MWNVLMTSKAAKQYACLPEKIQTMLDTLIMEIQLRGPVRGNWKNYSKLSGTAHHCHLKSGRPTYVACWEVKSKEVKIVEVYYVGTHENAPY